MRGGGDYARDNDEDHDNRARQQVLFMKLQRLLYCMEEQPDVMEGQGWQSLLFRAQRCQDLWHQTASTIAASTDSYNEIAHQVDFHCRKAQELAEEHQQKQQNRTEDRMTAEDTIDQLFFSSPSDKQADDTNNLNDEDYDEEDFTETEVDLSDDSSDEDDDNDDPQQDSTTPRTPSKKMSLADLQKAQREQMEDAIGAMARHMKDATRDMQQTIRKQTHTTLGDLETVAEQNVVDVTQVAKEVQDHNKAAKRKNFKLWTMLFVVGGVFCFCLMTIMTIPKRQGTCLIGCKQSVFRLMTTPIVKTVQTTISQTKWLLGVVDGYEHDDDLVDSDDESSDSEDDSQDEDNDSDDEEEETDDDEMMQTDQLQKLLLQLQEEQKKVDSGVVEEEQASSFVMEEFEHPTLPRPPPNKISLGDQEEEANPFGRKPVKKEPAKQEELVIDGVEEKVDAEEDEEVDGREEPIMEEGKEQVAEKTTADDISNLSPKMFGLQDSSFGTAAEEDDDMGSFERSGAAKNQFSPRDLRIAAGAGDLDRIKEYLEARPEFLNRQDKHGLTALHLAVQSGHHNVVQHLVSLDEIDLTLESEESGTAAAVAAQKLGPTHLITRVLQQAGRGTPLSDQQMNRFNKQERRRNALDSLSTAETDSTSHESYLQERRSKLDDFDPAKTKHQGKPVRQDIASNEDHDDQEYVEEGRKRLDALLGLDGL